MLLPSLLLTAHAGQTVQPKFHPNETHSYRIDTVEKDFEGASDKALKTLALGMPVQIKVVKVQGGKSTISVVTGPLFTRGRSVGRSKTNVYEVDSSTNSWNGNPYALLGVIYPNGGAKPGQSWSTKFRGSPPLAAGLTATYKLTKVMTQGGQKVALLTVKVTGDGSGRTRGGGQLVVGAGDGIVRSGKLHFDIAYMRPGRNKVLAVNSHDGLDYTIVP